MATQSSTRTLVAVVLLLLAALVLGPLVFAGFGMSGVGHMGPGMWGDGMWGDGPGSWIVIAGIVMQFLFLAALVVAGYLVYRSFTQSSDSTDRALEELRTAYARGELSDEEYENRRERLERDT